MCFSTTCLSYIPLRVHRIFSKCSGHNEHNQHLFIRAPSCENALRLHCSAHPSNTCAFFPSPLLPPHKCRHPANETGRYPYKSNGYLSEPEPHYDSDYATKYSTLDRRRLAIAGEQPHSPPPPPASTTTSVAYAAGRHHQMYNDDKYVLAHSS